MKAYFINAIQREISEVELDGSLRDILQQLGASRAHPVHHFLNKDHVWVNSEPDKEGTYFAIPGMDHPYPGSALIIGNQKGEDTDVQGDLDGYRNWVRFFSKEEAQQIWNDIDLEKIHSFRLVEKGGGYE